MIWYKRDISLSNLSDRNVLNQQIRALKEITAILNYLAKYVYQNASHAKKAVYSIALDKQISSYPEIKDLLLEAYRVALDSYNKFAQFCQQAVRKLTGQVKTMEIERKKFTEETFPETIRKRMKNV